eukprot:TRINITY_DN278_c0_g1_i1.p1 TRINITY_DN278_c0_g1~~TRINITY_DN278_c0_g1_i1.p1  ORF type:complete len:203 (-),score=18.32 TRINITY_DN278_c0_g1_i1:64-672(-)
MLLPMAASDSCSESCASSPSSTASSPTELSSFGTTARRKRSRTDEILLCDVCSLQFYHRLHLEQHIRQSHDVQSLPRTFHCRFEGCTSAFALLSYQQQHEHRVHGEGIECPECGKFLQHRQNLTRHLQAKHNHDNQKFACQQCERVYNTGVDLRRHVQRKHETLARLLCPTSGCVQDFGCKTALRAHLRKQHKVNPDTLQPL